ncbi:ABC transporter permease [Streptomyces sp. A7024]|uniref:Transport permease protein n=2 Tax=Streptomyces coryli TaxID=1128680 RepID=A0A6G4U704_9ACTN|nr:ABC transporter permease [Streptomyces coryli]
MTLGLLRDRAAVFFMLAFPLMFLALFGALFKNSETPKVNLVQIGQVQAFDKLPSELDDVLDITKSTDRDQALEDVRNGDQDAVIWQHGKEIELRFSQADPAKAGSVQSIVNSVVQQANIAATGKPPAYRLAPGTVEDKSMKAIQFFTPGLLGWAIAMGGVFGTAITLVNWRKKRILRRLWLAPIGPGPVIAARIGVTLGLALAQMAIFLAVATLPFYGLEMTGSWWLAVPLVACGSLAFMSIGLVVGAWAKSEEAANGLAQIIVLPMAFLSGSFFPLDQAPGWVQAVSGVFPLKHLVTATESVLSRGGGWGDALPVMGGLLLFAAVLTAVAAKIFRWDAA